MALSDFGTSQTASLLRYSLWLVWYRYVIGSTLWNMWKKDLCMRRLCVFILKSYVISFRPTSSATPFTPFMHQQTMKGSFSSSLPWRGTNDLVGLPAFLVPVIISRLLTSSCHCHMLFFRKFK